MQDVQNQRLIGSEPIDKVGVKGITYPILVMDKYNKTQATVATINMYVSLPSEYRGTHMSRFIETLNKYRGCFSRRKVRDILIEMKRSLQADAAYIELTFPYFIEKTAPVSTAKSLMNYECCWIASENSRNVFSQTIEVRVPVMNLCPCSKEISRNSAHNQRGYILVHIESNHLHWIEDIVGLVEACASSPVYSLLKREDEKFVTEQAYDNPRFVEDIVREIAQKLKLWHTIDRFFVEAENQESIHNHNAYAVIYSVKSDQQM